MKTSSPHRFRILLIDDNPAIHEDFRKILIGSLQRDAGLESVEAILFDAPQSSGAEAVFEIDSAYQGQEALEKVRSAVAQGNSYALAFVDVRMPPGWDGIETIEQLWKVDPMLQTVICTAYADYSWENMTARLGMSDNLLILKKPFDNVEVLQLAHALTKKWLLTQQAHVQRDMLEKMVQERTHALQLMNTELRRSEERFATAFRASPIGLAIQSMEDQRFIDVNDAFVEMTGFAREELVGRTPLDLSICIDYDGAVSGRSRREPRIYNVDAQISTKTGELRQAMISIEKITLSGVQHILLMAQDVTETRQLEAQLRQAQKMEAIGQLAAGVAHDFNNLLTVIQGHSSLQLARPHSHEDLSNSLRQIAHAAERAADLTRQLLAFSRRQIMRPQTLDLSEVIGRQSGLLKRLIPEQIDLQCHLPAGLPSVCADVTSIEQIVMNLTVNARDAMPRGGRILIETRDVVLNADDCLRNAEARPGQYVCISVADTGTGMDEVTRSHIFEPFFTTKDINKGTGMGLATVYGITKQHGGWVAVETALGIGSTFSVYIPASRQPVESPAVPVASENPPCREHTILVVEDDQAVRELVFEILSRHGHRVLQADCAESALRVWSDYRDEIELLLTDIVMPGNMTGLDLAAELSSEKPDLKVIYSSGYSTDLVASDRQLQDGSNYLPKPYLSTQLIAIVSSVLEPAEAQVAV